MASAATAPPGALQRLLPASSNTRCQAWKPLKQRACVGAGLSPTSREAERHAGRLSAICDSGPQGAKLPTILQVRDSGQEEGSKPAWLLAHPLRPTRQV